MKIFKIFFFAATIYMLAACSKFLDAKPDRAMAIVNSLENMQAIMNNEGRMNSNYPEAGDIASDYYYLRDADFNNLSDVARNNYLRQHVLPPSDFNWINNYSRIFDVNVVLKDIDNVDRGSVTEVDRARIKGEALFIRGFTFFALSQIYAPMYDEEQADALWGIPLRLHPDINVPTTRASLRETYVQILDDLSGALKLLPLRPLHKLAPAKVTVHAALSRVYMAMADYGRANAHADSCLAIYDKLMDYNDLDFHTVGATFEPLNDEVIYHCGLSTGTNVLRNTIANVDSVLFSLYEPQDLRRNAFYRTNSTGLTGFYGDYGGSINTSSFCGLATDEVYLNKAEASVRLGKLDEGRKYLNSLLEHRFVKGYFHPITETNHALLLERVLEERRKELAFRGGLRWSDLRRLVKEGRMESPLLREINGALYTLDAGDPEWNFLLPYDVVHQTGMPQN